MEEDRPLVDVGSQVVPGGAQPDEQCCERGGRAGCEHCFAQKEVRALHVARRLAGFQVIVALGLGHERRNRSRASADRRGRGRDPRRGRKRRRRLPRRGLRVLGRGEHADRARGRRLSPRPPCARPERPAARLLRRPARKGAWQAAGAAHGVDRRRLRRDVAGRLSDRGRLVRRSRRRRRIGGRPRALRVAPLEPAVRTGRRARPRRRRAHAATGVPACDPRPHPAPLARRPGDLRRARADASGRPRGHARPRPNARAPGGGRRTGALRGRAGTRARALPGRQRRPDHAGRPGRVPGHLAAPDPRLVCRARVRLEPASVLGRRPRRVRALAPRPSRSGRPARERGGDRAARRGDARAVPRPRGTLRRRSLPRRAGPEALLGAEHGRGAAADRGARRRGAASPRVLPARRTSRSSTSKATPRRSPRPRARGPASSSPAPGST